MHVDVSALVGPLACIGRTSARAVDREGVFFFQTNENKGLVRFFSTKAANHHKQVSSASSRKYT